MTDQMIQEYFKEISRSFLHIGRREETFSKWSNNYLATRTTKGIHIYEFSHNLENLDKKCCFLESYIEVLPSSPATKLLQDSIRRGGIENKDMIDLMVDTAMWPHSDRLVSERVSILDFEFSPRGFIRTNDCALAVINNIGNVTVYKKCRNEWISAVDISSLVKDQFSKGPKYKPHSFQELKESVYELVSGAICWAPDTQNGNCYFVTYQKCGSLLFWLVNSQEQIVTAKFISKIDLVYDEIICLQWIPKSGENFMLICSTILGQVMVLECKANKENIVLIKPHLLWEHKDKMVAKIFKYQMIEKNVLLLFNKHRHLVAQMIDENFNIISQSVKNINEHRITDLVQHNSHFIVTTVNFKVYKVYYSWTGKELDIVYEIIELEDIPSTMELYSINFSLNDTICAMLALDRRVLHRKQPLLLAVILFKTGPENAEIEMLVNNPTKQLSNYWDCIEYIRYKICKLKLLPEFDFNALLSDGETDIYKLKVYLILLRIYNNLVSNIKIPAGILPETSIEKVEDKILAIHAQSNIKKLYSIHSAGESLTDFQEECLVGSMKYLQLYNQKYKKGVMDPATPDVTGLVKKEYKYTCQCCDGDILSFSCVNGHSNMFCTITFTPIDSLDYLSCRNCNITARHKVIDNDPLCLFCDGHLENSIDTHVNNK